MATHGHAHYTGPDNIEALTEDREKMWSGFTTATTSAVIVMVVVLIGMAVFLL